ncbi:MAG: hypothetical protein V1901_04115 [Patescibacteria group bacterium]
MPKRIFICVDCGRNFYKENHILLCNYCKPKFDLEKVVEENKIEEFNTGSDRYRNQFLKDKQNENK